MKIDFSRRQATNQANESAKLVAGFFALVVLSKAKEKSVLRKLGFFNKPAGLGIRYGDQRRILWRVLLEAAVPAERNVHHLRVVELHVGERSALRRPPDCLVFGQNLLLVQPVRNAELFVVRRRVGHLLSGAVEAGPVVEIVGVRDHQGVASGRPVRKVKLELVV